MRKDILLLFVLLGLCVCLGLFQTGCFYKVPS